MALSKNFEKEVLRREKPGCYGKFKVKSEDKKTKKECGMCWFNPYCKSGKELPRNKTTKKVVVKKDTDK